MIPLLNRKGHKSLTVLKQSLVKNNELKVAKIVKFAIHASSIETLEQNDKFLKDYEQWPPNSVCKDEIGLVNQY